MKKYVFFLTLMVAILLVFTACNGNNDAEILETEQPQVVANTASGQSAGSHQQAETNFTDINDFWAHYRQAVINQDFETLATMTNFPLRSLGMFYTDPIVYIERNEFESAFARFLAQEQTVTHIYEDGEITDSMRTNFEFIVQNENLAFLSDDERGALHINDRQNSGSIEGSWARAYDEIFEIMDGVWRLTAFYEQQTMVLSDNQSPENNQPTDTEIEMLYYRAVEVYSWFRMVSMPADSDDTVMDEDGNVYFRVVVDGINSLADLEAHMHTIFATDIVEDLMDFRHPPVMYRDFDGVLFTVGGERGSDITRGGESHEIIRNIREDNPNIIYRVTVDILYWDNPEEVVDTVIYDFVLSLVDGNWMFLNFNLTR